MAGMMLTRHIPAAALRQIEIQHLPHRRLPCALVDGKHARGQLAREQKVAPRRSKRGEIHHSQPVFAAHLALVDAAPRFRFQHAEAPGGNLRARNGQLAPVRTVPAAGKRDPSAPGHPALIHFRLHILKLELVNVPYGGISRVKLVAAHVVFQRDAHRVVPVQVRNLHGDVVPLAVFQIHVVRTLAHVAVGHGMVALVIQLHAQAHGAHAGNLRPHAHGDTVPFGQILVRQHAHGARLRVNTPAPPSGKPVRQVRWRAEANAVPSLVGMLVRKLHLRVRRERLPVFKALAVVHQSGAKRRLAAQAVIGGLALVILHDPMRVARLFQKPRQSFVHPCSLLLLYSVSSMREAVS